MLLVSQFAIMAWTHHQGLMSVAGRERRQKVQAFKPWLMMIVDFFDCETVLWLLLVEKKNWGLWHDEKDSVVNVVERAWLDNGSGKSKQGEAKGLDAIVIRYIQIRKGKQAFAGEEARGLCIIVRVKDGLLTTNILRWCLMEIASFVFSWLFLWMGLPWTYIFTWGQPYRTRSYHLEIPWHEPYFPPLDTIHKVIHKEPLSVCTMFPSERYRSIVAQGRALLDPNDSGPNKRCNDPSPSKYCHQTVKVIIIRPVPMLDSS